MQPAMNLAPPILAQRLYPTSPETLDARLRRTQAAGGLPPLYDVKSDPHDMCTASLLPRGTAASPGAEVRIAFLDSLQDYPLP